MRERNGADWCFVTLESVPSCGGDEIVDVDRFVLSITLDDGQCERLREISSRSGREVSKGKKDEDLLGSDGQALGSLMESDHWVLAHNFVDLTGRVTPKAKKARGDEKVRGQ